MDPLSFIPVTAPAEIETVKSLAAEIWPGYYEPIIGRPQVDFMLSKIQSPEAIQAQIKNGSLYYLIQPAAESPIGYLAVIPKTNELFLSKLYLTAESRGKGWGRRALDFVREGAEAQNLKKISLTVHKRNPSVGIYQKMGFKITEPIVTDIGGGFVMDDFRMELTLGPRD